MEASVRVKIRGPLPQDLNKGLKRQPKAGQLDLTTNYAVMYQKVAEMQKVDGQILMIKNSKLISIIDFGYL